MTKRKLDAKPAHRGQAWTESEYDLIHAQWSQGVPARLIAGTCKSAKPLSKRKIREHVAELNRAAGTPRGRQRLRREETGAALVLESVRGRTGRPRMLNVKELNAFVRGKREWADTSYHATYRDVKAIDAFGVGSAAACRGVLRSTRARAQRRGDAGMLVALLGEVRAGAAKSGKRGLKSQTAREYRKNGILKN